MTDAWDSLILRHGLTFAEAVRIRDEVDAGHAFAEPHIRAAAVEWHGTAWTQKESPNCGRRDGGAPSSLSLS